MGLPGYFSATTLRTISTQTGHEEARVRALAETVCLDLRVGASGDAALGARMMVELAARTVGMLTIDAPAPLATELAVRARAINPNVTLGPGGSKRRVGVGIHAPAPEVAVCSVGWWAGLGHDTVAPEESSNNPFGANLAGIVAFCEFFKIAYEPLLTPLAPTPASGPGWSLLDWQCRAPTSADRHPLPSLAHPPTALVGCGAIGHAAAFVLGQLAPVEGELALVDPQTISGSNLQRYLGTSAEDARDNTHKVKSAARLLAGSHPQAALNVYDWSGYRGRGGQPEAILCALDSGQDRRILQASLPRLIVNGWTRLAECGLTTHYFLGDEQCLQCTYLPHTPGGVANDMAQIVVELGLEPIRVVHLLSGAPLTPPDLRAIERRRGISVGALDRWRGESVRPLFGHLCGMAEVRSGTQEHYVVPLPQSSALAGLLVASQFVQWCAGLAIRTRPLEVSVLRGPGDAWQQSPALKTSHPAVCICKDPVYLRTYKRKWPRS